MPATARRTSESLGLILTGHALLHSLTSATPPGMENFLLAMPAPSDCSSTERLSRIQSAIPSNGLLDPDPAEDGSPALTPAFLAARAARSRAFFRSRCSAVRGFLTRFDGLELMAGTGFLTWLEVFSAALWQAFLAGWPLTALTDFFVFCIEGFPFQLNCLEVYRKPAARVNCLDRVFLAADKSTPRLDRMEGTQGDTPHPPRVERACERDPSGGEREGHPRVPQNALQISSREPLKSLKSIYRTIYPEGIVL